MSILKKENLEKLLIANWTQFLDIQKVMSFVLEQVRNNLNNFALIEQGQYKAFGTNVTISRFQIIPTGFIIWAEFKTSLDDKFVIGTTEFILTNSGSLQPVETIGNMYFFDRKNKYN